MGDVLRIEARRSLLLRLSPLVALAHVAIMLSQVSSWRGVWPQASAAVLRPLIFTAPALAGLTALEVSRRSTRWAAPRPPWAAPLLGVQVVAAGVVVACGCVAAVVVNLAAGAPQGLLWPGYVVLALCVAAEAVACGHLLGRVPGPLWFAPVTSVTLVFLRIVLTLPGSDLPPAGRLTRVILSGPRRSVSRSAGCSRPWARPCWSSARPWRSPGSSAGWPPAVPAAPTRSAPPGGAGRC